MLNYNERQAVEIQVELVLICHVVNAKVNPNALLFPLPHTNVTMLKFLKFYFIFLFCYFIANEAKKQERKKKSNDGVLCVKYM